MFTFVPSVRASCFLHHLPLSTTSSLSLELLAVNHSLFAIALSLDEHTVCRRVSGLRTPHVKAG